jgi:tRNA(Ile)-lysidine synthase
MDLQTALSQCVQALGGTKPTVAVALSGGRDSIALLHAACALREVMPMQLRAIHIHHGLSAQAGSWAAFCAQECIALNVAHTQIAVNIDHANTAGVESHARIARYQAFAQMDVDAILLAHHADDQIETTLHRLFRGAGLTGLGGMQVSRPLNARTQLLRPWLKINRAQIEAYVAQHQLKWVEDNSNTNTAHTRNFLRHDILPVLQTHFPQVKQAVAHMVQHAQEHAEFAEALARIDLGMQALDPDCVSPKIGTLNAIGMMNIEALDTLPLARQTNALYYFLRWQGFNQFTHAELVTWAGLLFRPIQPNRPNRAGGHHVIITRKRNGLWVKWVE